jgi:hypothetical protein
MLVCKTGIAFPLARLPERFHTARRVAWVTYPEDRSTTRETESRRYAPGHGTLLAWPEQSRKK